MSTIRGQFKLSDRDNLPVFIEVEEPSEDGGYSFIANADQQVAEAEMSFETALDHVKPVKS